MIPLFAFLYNRGQSKEKNYSLINIFPYFVLGFIGMIIVRNIGDQQFLNNKFHYDWQSTIEFIKTLSKISLTMAMAAIGLSTNLRDIRKMGYKPFLVGFIGMSTVGIVSILIISLYFNYII